LKGIITFKPGAILNGFIEGFVSLLELIAEFAKLISFSFRLFGNMLAGEILLLAMTFLVAAASPILVVFYGLELFVGAIQAFVFGTLTLVFAVMAVAAHGPEEHGEEAHH
jgi:F-type H+-transporting ATPase subunit a